MTPITITVASIEWPKDGKKTGRVIDSTGKAWYVWANEVSNYQQFTTYEITEYKTNDFKGKTYYTIAKAKQLNLNGSKVAASTIQSQRPSAPIAYSEDQRRMDIFVCGAFNNVMANPSIDPKGLTVGEVRGFLEIFKAAWKSSLGPQAQPTIARGALDNELNDSIPDFE